MVTGILILSLSTYTLFKHAPNLLIDKASGRWIVLLLVALALDVFGGILLLLW